MVVSHYFAYDSNSKLFIAVTKESDKISTRLPSNEDVFEIKLEQNDIHDSMVDLAEQVENNFDCTKLSQNIYRFGEKVSGSY